MKNRKVIVGIIVIGIITLIGISNIYKNTKERKHLTMDIKNSYAIMLKSEEDNEYHECEGLGCETWPQSGYMFNKEETTCYDNASNVIEEELVKYSNRNKEAEFLNNMIMIM